MRPRFVVVSVCPNDFGEGYSVLAGKGDWLGEAVNFTTIRSTMTTFLLVVPRSGPASWAGAFFRSLSLEFFFTRYWTDDYISRRLLADRTQSLVFLETQMMYGTRRRFAGLLLLCFVGLVASPSLARGQGGPPIAKPTPEHEALAKDAGTWDATVKSWMQPNSAPAVSEGVETIKVLPGGLWAISEFHGKFGDMDFHGCGTTGYDTKKKKFVGSWVDSMTTELMTMEGEYDPATRTVTFYAKGTDPAGKPYESRMSSKHEDDNTRVFTMSMKSDETKGEYMKVMEITYKRRAK
jgi:hypothetical protein